MNQLSYLPLGRFSSTMYIKNKRDSSNIKACSPFELSCKLKVLCFEIAYFSYTYRYVQAEQTIELITEKGII